MAGTEYFDKIVVRTIEFAATGKVVTAASGVDGLATAAPGTKPVISSIPTAPANTAGAAGATYTATEQALINALITQVNSLSAALKSSGHMK